MLYCCYSFTQGAGFEQDETDGIHIEVLVARRPPFRQSKSQDSFEGVLGVSVSQLNACSSEADILLRRSEQT